MSVQSKAPPKTSDLPENGITNRSEATPRDRTTVIVVVALVVGTLVLIGLVAALTLIPSQTLSRAVAQESSVQQEQIAESVARQLETLFNVTANDLISLAGRDEIRSTASDLRSIGQVLLAEVGSQHIGQIKSIVRLDRSGAPLYGWPDAVSQQIATGQPLDWRVDAGVMQPVTQNGGVQLVRRSGRSGLVYLLVAPVTTTAGSVEALAIEIDLSAYLAQNFDPLKLSDSTQIWVFDPNGPQTVYQRHPTPTWTVSQISFDTLAGSGTAAGGVLTRTQYPTADRDAVIAPIYTAFTQARNRTPSLILVISRISVEGQSEVYDTLNKLFVGGVGVVILIILMGLALGRYVVIEANRQRAESQRRDTVRTLLEMSQALNSSLDLPVVLNRILDELARFMPHDGASVMLLESDPDEPSVYVAAQRGEDVAQSDSIPLRKVRGTREVVRSGKPVVINDTRNDPRWHSATGSHSTAAWMGVPLRLRDQAVGVLNINSGQPNRFGQEDAVLAAAFADQACVAIENARAHELQIRQYESELETAHAIQTSLLPTEAPPMPQIQISAYSSPARHVSGDYYQYLPLPDGRLGVAVGDVSGKGIPAALLMAVITTALRDEVLRHPTPAPLLNQLNLTLIDRMQSNSMNSALLVSVFDPATRHVEIANAGMVQPYLRTESGWEFVPVGGYPLGASIRSSYTSKTVTLAPGAMLLFISDGVVESQNSVGEFFGFERLEALLNQVPISVSSAELVDGIWQAVRNHLNGLEAQDDITIVAMKSIDI